MTQALDVVVMAAGKGTRMKSRYPKVLQKLAGRGLIEHVLDTALTLSPRRLVLITGHEAEQVEAAVRARYGTAGVELEFVRQSPQLGTGHAVQQAVPKLRDDGVVLVLSGDVPLTGGDLLRQVVAASSGGKALALLTVSLADPKGYGRILRRAGGSGVLGIVEEKDASAEQRLVREAYSGIMAAPAAALRRWVGQLSNDNAQQEYYLTDVVKMAVDEGLAVEAVCTTDAWEVAGVNSPQQLAELERIYQRQHADALMLAGVRMADPARFDVRGQLSCGQDVFIDVNCVFSGTVTLGDGVSIGPNCVIANAVIEAGAQLQAFTHIDGGKEGATVGPECQIGPFSRLRPGATLGRDVHIGNFVEVKNSVLADGAKANHLAYLGDATVGEKVNYGAGSITANYDGANKHRTVIGAGAHIGSNCVLVAPVVIGEGATIGGGSTISKNAPPGQLTVARARQTSLDKWARPVKAKK
jgi:bifunctional UDP-N-acetylglucosamine pyrophosphorylase/glucosamine-1-phosphate N-acetyltransferase